MQGGNLFSEKEIEVGGQKFLLRSNNTGYTLHLIGEDEGKQIAGFKYIPNGNNTSYVGIVGLKDNGEILFGEDGTLSTYKLPTRDENIINKASGGLLPILEFLQKNCGEGYGGGIKLYQAVEQAAKINMKEKTPEQEGKDLNNMTEDALRTRLAKLEADNAIKEAKLAEIREQRKKDLIARILAEQKRSNELDAAIAEERGKSEK